MMQQEPFVCVFAHDPGFCVFSVTLVVDRKMNMGGLGQILENGGTSVFLCAKNNLLLKPGDIPDQ